MVMSYIMFENSKVKEAERKEKKQARDAVLKKVMQLPWLPAWRLFLCEFDFEGLLTFVS
jgi:hypothetical protein